jgi:hypothetical protein
MVLSTLSRAFSVNTIINNQSSRWHPSNYTVFVSFVGHFVCIFGRLHHDHSLIIRNLLLVLVVQERS